MARILAVLIAFTLGVTVFVGPVSAQETVPGTGIVTNADGADVSSVAGVNPTAIGDAGTVVYGDITSGPGGITIGPPISVPVEGGAPPPAAPAEPVPSDGGAPAPQPTATDADGDNLDDGTEAALGTDPFNLDTDGDQLDDGYEVNAIGTDPLVYDTDGDGLFDGQEVFGTFTDPLTFNAGTAGDAAAPAAPPSTFSSPQPAPAVTSTEPGEASTRGPGAATAAPGTVSAPSAGATLAAPTGSTCGGYASWYDAQLAYEAAGGLSADPGFVSAFDPDYDGIACEDRM